MQLLEVSDAVRPGVKGLMRIEKSFE